MTRNPRVVVIGQEPNGRAEVQKMLALSGFAVLGEAGYGMEAMSLARQTEPDVVVIAIEEPLIRALQTVEAMADLLPQVADHRPLLHQGRRRHAQGDAGRRQGLPGEPGEGRGADQLDPHRPGPGRAPPRACVRRDGRTRRLPAPWSPSSAPRVASARPRSPPTWLRRSSRRRTSPWSSSTWTRASATSRSSWTSRSSEASPTWRFRRKRSRKSR